MVHPKRTAAYKSRGRTATTIAFEAVGLPGATLTIAPVPLQPGESLHLSFEVHAAPHGFRNNGADAFVVSERGRVIARVPRTKRPELARIWVGRDVALEPGSLVDGDLRVAVGAVAPLAGSRFPGRVASVATGDAELTLRLRSGLELRLGEPANVELKLAVAGRILPLLPRGSGYLDLSVPDRPVAGPPTLDSQVEVETSTSSGA